MNRSTESLSLQLTSERLAAIAVVNDAAKVVRRRFVTDLPGQEMMYLRKEARARAFLAEPVTPADLTAYPLIAAEIGITAQTAAEVAQVYINLAFLWETVGAALETVRLGAISAIETAADTTAIDQTLTSFFTAMEAFDAPA